MPLLNVIGVLLIVGVALWGIDRLPWFDASIKLIIRVLIIVVTVIWLIGLIFGSSLSQIQVGG